MKTLLRHKAHILFFFLGMISLTSFSQCYELVWSEEFNYDGLPNPAIWNMESGGSGWGNNELEYYKANDLNNCHVSDGTLKITALKEDYSSNHYTSARIQSKGKAEFQYGKMEARIKMPYGQGIWPAFWMLGDSKLSWPACGEIDIVEMIGGNATGRDNTCYGTLHWDNNGHAQSGSSKKLSSGILADTFHIYAIEWNKTSVKLFLDGIKYYEVNTTSAAMTEFQNYFYFILNLAVGGNWPGKPDASTVFPQTMEVDYVRVYKSADQLSIHGLSAVNAQQKNIVFSMDTLQGWQYSWSVPEGATILSRPDSSTIVVDWGCNPGDVTCELTTSCGTSSFTLPVAVNPLTLTSSIFYDQKAGNQVFSLPYFENTEYSWTVPEGVTIISGSDSSKLTVAWNDQPGTISVRMSNQCSTDTFQQYLRHYQQLPYPDPDVPHAVPGTIKSVDFDYGGEGVAYHDTDAAHQGGGPRSTERVDTQVQTNFDCVGYITTNEWLDYTIAVKDSAYYKITLQLASAATGNMGPIRILVNNEPTSRIPDITATVTGAWTTFKSVTATRLKLTPHDTILTILAVNGNYNLGPFTIAKDPNAVLNVSQHQQQMFNIFPNPSSDHIQLIIPDQYYYANINLKIMDLAGRSVLCKRSFQPTELVDIKNLSSGYYILELKNEKNIPLMSRFLKQ